VLQPEFSDWQYAHQNLHVLYSVLVLSGPPAAPCALAPSQVNRQQTVQSPKHKCGISPADEKTSIQDAQYQCNSKL